jgi:adenylate cyclase
MMGSNMQPQYIIAEKIPPQIGGLRYDDIWPTAEHRFATVLAADVVGYTRLMSIDEAGTHARYKSRRRELIEPKIAELDARVVKSTGDGVLVEFRNALDAVRCAIQVQQHMAERNRGEPDDHRIVFRIGLSYGRIIVEPDDIYGDEVNIAARLQAVAPPGGIAMSAKVADLIPDTLRLQLEDLGPQQLRNMGRAVHTYVYRLPH